MPGRESDVVLERLSRLHPKKIDLTLGRTLDLLERLERPQDRLPPVVHIAGTNGKGSAVAFLSAIVQAAGCRVHAYTSPHLVRFNERIRLAGVPIDEDNLLRLLERCETANAGRPITFFEITTCAAFVAFAETPADLLVLETGLGGTFDSTNVVARPALTVITPISIDHVQFLGGTISEIASNKAGILKPGVPCVVGPQPAAALDVLEARAAALGVALYRYDREWQVDAVAGGMRVRLGTESFDLPRPGLFGPHQLPNAATAVVAARLLTEPCVPVAALGRGVADAHWPGRLQRLARGPLVDALPGGWELWVDGGHNANAAEALAAVAREWRDRPLYLVVGMLNTRAPADFLQPLAPLAAAIHAVPVPDAEASHRAEDVAAAALACGAPARVAPSAADAVAGIVRSGAPPGRILICGSLYLVGSTLADHG